MESSDRKMGYGLYLADIETFNDLVDWLEDHIKNTLSELGAGKAPKELRKILKELIEDVLEDEIKKYGWTGDEELPDVVAVNMFHEAFAAYNKQLYINWYRMNVEELEDESPFNYETSKEAFDEMKQLYQNDGVKLTNPLLVQELKRGIHTKLFSIMQTLDYTLEQEANIASIQEDGKLKSNQVVQELTNVLEKVLKLDKQVNDIVNLIEKLDYSTNDYE